MIDRSSFYDAKITFEKLISDESTRLVLIDFICSAIDYANSLDSSNWNLNLDKNGQFIRVNIGHEYCIQIDKDELLILCDRITLKSILDSINFDMLFLGHIKKEQIRLDKMEKVPDCLAKTKNSIGCLFQVDLIPKNINILKQSNCDFIKQAIRTVMLPQMKEAHSQGAIEYLSFIIQRRIPNPNYNIFKLPTLGVFLQKEQKVIQKARKLSSEQRQKMLKGANSKPTKVVINQTIFKRNPYVVAEVLERANGYCEMCKNKAPFLRDNDGTPYLEVHHIVSLSNDGDDTVENTIALCPNCHRRVHYGKKIY